MNRFSATAQVLATKGQMPALAEGVCPKAPAGMAGVVNDIQGNVKWGVIILIGLAFLVGVGAIVAGRLLHNPPTSRFGVVTLVVDVIAAVILVGGYATIQAILGNGCGNS